MNIVVEPTQDEAYIKSVLLNPSIYNDMKDDGAPEDPHTLINAPIMTLPGFFLRVLIDDVPSGVWWLLWRDGRLEAHTALLGNCRGITAIKATKIAIKWVFDNTEAEAITSYAWSDAPAVAWFCRAVGMEKRNTEHWNNTRNGKPVDITYYEIRKPI